MFADDLETNFNEKSFHLNYQQWYSDNDDDCSCSSCECSSFSDENILVENNTMSLPSMNMSITELMHYPTLKISHINDSLSGLNKHERFSTNYNCPSINSSKEQDLSTIEIEKDEELSAINFEHMYEIIDQSYTKIPILYNSIKQTKLDRDFIVSVNDYLDRLKSNIYKDLIRRETLLRNGKLHARNLISLLRSICQISYEQANDLPKNSIPSKHAILYTMTAIDYILQNNFPQKKSLFNYILHEYISMWLHENLREIQEDFSIIVDNETNKNFFSFCRCLFNKLESICAVNWERLQMIQNYRLTHFDQLLKPTSIQLETKEDFVLLFGKPVKLTMKTSGIPITSLYSNRTDNEWNNIDKIHQIFRKSIAKILCNNLATEGQKVTLHSQPNITLCTEVTTSTSILEKPTGTLISETPTSADKPILLPSHSFASKDQFLISSPLDICEKRQSESKLATSEHQQLSASIELISEQNASSTIHAHQSPSQSDSSLSHSQMSTKTKSDTSPLVQTIESINRSNEPISLNLLQSQTEDKSSVNLSSTDFQLQEPLNLPVTSPQKPLTDDPPSPLSYQIPANQNITTDSKSILTAEVNALINFLTELANSSPSIQQGKEPSLFVEQLESCLKENNIDTTSIIEKIRIIRPQLSPLSVEDPLFLAEFTRVLRKELEDAQILREIDCGQLHENAQNIGYVSFETSNILKLPNRNTSLKKKDTAAEDNIDQNRIFIEVTHDPSKCSPNHTFSSPKYHSCVSSSPKSTIFSKSNNQQSSFLESNHSPQPWSWIHSDENSLSQDCLITSNSLFCVRKSFDENTYSITVEHNEEF